MVIIKGEKMPTTCDECWAFETIDIRGDKMGVCLITQRLLNLKGYVMDCPMEEVDDG